MIISNIDIYYSLLANRWCDVDSKRVVAEQDDWVEGRVVGDRSVDFILSLIANSPRTGRASLQRSPFAFSFTVGHRDDLRSLTFDEGQQQQQATVESHNFQHYNQVQVNLWMLVLTLVWLSYTLRQPQFQ